MVLLEAMCHGVAVVTTPVGGIPDLLVDGQNGLLIPPGRPAAIAEALLRLLQNPEERDRLGLAGQRTVQNAHSIHRISQLLSEIYSGLHTGPLPARSARSVPAGYTP
jgi:glycosyltransferase involved in cell wall biosynthesis